MIELLMLLIMTTKSYVLRIDVIYAFGNCICFATSPVFKFSAASKRKREKKQPPASFCLYCSNFSGFFPTNKNEQVEISGKYLDRGNCVPKDDRYLFLAHRKF